MRIAFFGFCLAFPLAQLVHATSETAVQARAALTQGDYKQALLLTNNDEDIASLLLQAETQSTMVMLGYVEDPHKTARQARQRAEKALRAAPDNPEAHIQYALALGFEARTAGIFRAWSRRLPQKSRAAIDEALRVAPDDARSHALSGAWHLGIVRKAGDERAQRMYGASLAQGIAAYEKALQTKPDDIIIAGNYIVALLLIDPEAHGSRLLPRLKHLLSLSPKSASEAEIQKRLSRVLELWDKPEDCRNLIAELMNDPDEDTEKWAERFE